MPRYTKGILGARQDPKNQILFSFKAREGEEWPSDEDDSDYSPGLDPKSKQTSSDDDSDYSAGVNKKTKTKASVKKRRKPGNEDDTDSDYGTSDSRPASKRKATASVKKRRIIESDDDSDSEYGPGQSEASSSKKRAETKQKKAKTNKSSGSRRTVRSEPGPSGVNGTVQSFKGSIPSLPTELWDRVFKHIVKKEGAIPFLPRAARVCKLWRDICSDPNLWTSVDLSYGWIKLNEARFRWLCTHRLSECTNLNLTSAPVMAKMASVKDLADNCPNLRVLNLSQCNKLPTDSVNMILKQCKHLQDLDLTATTADSVSSQTLCQVANVCGVNLRGLVLANNLIKSFNNVMPTIMEKCPNLEHLDVSNVNFSGTSFSIYIERFQRSCPRLKILRVANASFRFSAASQMAQLESKGFPALEEVSVARLRDVYYEVTHWFISRLLRSSERLRLLDMRGCRDTRAIAALEDLPATHLKQLYLSRSGIISCQNLHRIINKWRHSLTDLDLSWNIFKAGILELTLVTVCSGEPACTLRNINLAGTTVSTDMVRKLLTSLPKLESLDLTSCRDLARGCKREYKTRADLNILRKTIKA